MADGKGQESGHRPGDLAAVGLPPLSWSWGEVVDRLAAERGGLAELARHLLDVAPEGTNLSDDPQTVERGLRRLRGRGHGDGGRYGRLLARCLGLPGELLAWARELGQYHSRASDLSLAKRQDLLARWDGPPLSESVAIVWVHIGLASVALRRGDLALTDQRLRLAALLRKRAEAAARLELGLLEARLSSDAGRGVEADEGLTAVADELQRAGLGPDARACYYARLQDQRAFRLTAAWRDGRADLVEALALYEAIPTDDAPPFALFRREHGRAFCLWRLGRREEALEAAGWAADHAGDGGFIRFRAMALTLTGHILGPGEAQRAVGRRAVAMARRLGDLDLAAKAAKISP